MGYPLADLERRLTEFQVALDTEGRVVGAVGLQFSEKQGLIHYEAFPDFSLADAVRPDLWERVQQVARNNGLLRIWTCEEAPFWNRCGLTTATPEALNKLPALWRGKESRWLTLQLREETASTHSVEREFEVFMAAEKQRTLATMERAKLIETVGNCIGLHPRHGSHRSRRLLPAQTADRASALTRWRNRPRDRNCAPLARWPRGQSPTPAPAPRKRRTVRGSRIQSRASVSSWAAGIGQG